MIYDTTYPQNIWNRIQEPDLQQRHKVDQEFVLSVRMLSEIAFLQPNDETKGFKEFANHLWNVYNGYVIDLLQYFEDTYIDRYRRNAPRQQPSFPIHLWSKSSEHTTIFPAWSTTFRSSRGLFKVTSHRVIRICGNLLGCCKKKTGWSVMISFRILLETLLQPQQKRY